jgi:hypothetical protein
MDFYNCWDFNPDGESGQLLHMMRFSDIIRMYRNMDMSGNSIKNMSDGFDAGDAVNKSQLDTKLNLAGGTMTDDITLPANVYLNLGTENRIGALSNNDIILSRGAGSNKFVSISDTEMEMRNIYINMGDNKIVNVGTPTADTDVANKKYVDDSLIYSKSQYQAYTNLTGTTNEIYDKTFNIPSSTQTRSFSLLTNVYLTAPSNGDLDAQTNIDFEFFNGTTSLSSGQIIYNKNTGYSNDIAKQTYLIAVNDELIIPVNCNRVDINISIVSSNSLDKTGKASAELKDNSRF